jgi:hypothetical protein
VGQYVSPEYLGIMANDHAAEAKNEKFMRFNMGDDAEEGDTLGDDGAIGIVEEEEGVSTR